MKRTKIAELISVWEDVAWKYRAMVEGRAGFNRITLLARIDVLEQCIADAKAISARKRR